MSYFSCQLAINITKADIKKLRATMRIDKDNPKWMKVHVHNLERLKIVLETLKEADKRVKK